MNVQLPLSVHPLVAAPWGVGHGTHWVPQEIGLVSGEQTPLQLWVPVGHVSLQAAVASMQLPLHSFWFAGQVPPQTPATQVAVPPLIAGHEVHEVPQLAGSVDFKHFPTLLQ